LVQAGTYCLPIPAATADCRIAAYYPTADYAYASFFFLKFSNVTLIMFRDNRSSPVLVLAIF